MKLSERPLQIPKMFLFVGKPGSGKSVAAASFPKPMLIIDLDGRIQAVANYYAKRGLFSLDEVEFYQYGPANMKNFISRMDELEQDALNMRFKYRSVIIDSLTSLADNGLSYFIDWRGQNRRKTDEEGKKGKAGKSLAGVDLNTIEDFGAENRLILSLIEIGRIIPAYMILTAHETIVEIQEIGEEKPRIEKMLLTGGRKVAARIPAYFDELYYFTTRGSPPSFIVRTQSSGADPGKTTLPLQYELDFTNKSFFNLMIADLAGKGVVESTVVKQLPKPQAEPQQPTTPNKEQ